MKQIAAIALGLTVLAACVPDITNTEQDVPAPADAAAVQTLTDPGDGTEIVLQSGGVLELKLDSNPTTGYFWYLKDIDASHIGQVRDGYVADPAPEGVTGSGGHQIFVFEGLSAGDSELILSYERSPNDVFETLTLKIEVTE